MEIENTAIRFLTRIAVKSKTVIVAKPPGLREGLKKQATVRFRLPESGGREVRMEVTAPHFNLSSGQPVFLCKTPTAYVEHALRTSLRFSTARFKSIQLRLSAPPESYRVMDLSMAGCQVHLNDQKAREVFQVGVPIAGVAIQLADKASVDLERLVPRSLRTRSVGCEFSVQAEGNSRSILQRLLESFEHSELAAASGSAQLA